MSEKILVPVLGESINEATVTKWLKAVGDNVEADEPIVELETDKVNLEVPSPISGILTEINSKDGSIVEVGSLLGSVSESNSDSKKEIKIEKIKPTQKEDNIINLETPKKEPEIFEKVEEIFEEVKSKDQQESEQPLILTKEIQIEKKEKNNQRTRFFLLQ